MNKLNGVQMSEIAKNRIRRMHPPEYARSGSRFCVEGVYGFDPEDNLELSKKKGDLLSGVEGYEEDGENGVHKCTIGGCDRKINHATGERTGTCKAASYCLKRAFEAVGNTPTVEEGRALHREIIDTCDGAMDRHNAGHFCPRLDCGLSAGVSVDQIPGTHGTCIVKKSE